MGGGEAIVSFFSERAGDPPADDLDPIPIDRYRNLEAVGTKAIVSRVYPYPIDRDPVADPVTEAETVTEPKQTGTPKLPPRDAP